MIMSKVNQKIELAANILIIVAATLLIGFVIQKYFFSKSGFQEVEGPTVGSKLLLHDLDFSKTNKTLLLVLQKGCHFCSESADFYKSLIVEAKTKNVTVFAILPQDREEAEEYLRSFGIQGIEIRQSQLSSLEVGGTPAVILTNSNGEVSNSWMGKLSLDKEREVFSKLN